MNQLLVAHRGAMIESPENTRAAFDKAVSYGVDGIELDVQITRDGIPVIFHDKTIKKITRTSKTISDYTYQELLGFDFGAWFSEDHRGEKILTLEEVLKRYGSQTRLFIELKSAPHRKKDALYSGLPLLVTRLVRQIIPNKRIRNIYVLSFDPSMLTAAYLNDSKLNYVLNLESSIIDPAGLKIDMDILYGCCLAYKKLTEKFVSYYHQFNKKVMTYSCNTQKMINRAFSLNIDVLMTDNPGGLNGFFLNSRKKQC